MALPTSGPFAVWRDTTFEVMATAEDTLNLVVPRDGTVPPHVGEGEDRRGRRWVKVRKSDLERYFERHVTVQWKGEEVGLGRVDGDTAEIHASSPAVAGTLGLDGDQYNGFHATVPVEELAVVDVQEREIDV